LEGLGRKEGRKEGSEMGPLLESDNKVLLEAGQSSSSVVVFSWFLGPVVLGTHF